MLGVTVMYFCADEPPSTGLNVPSDTPPELEEDDETGLVSSEKPRLPGATVNVQGTTGGAGEVTVSVTATVCEVPPMLTVIVPVWLPTDRLSSIIDTVTTCFPCPSATDCGVAPSHVELSFTEAVTVAASLAPQLPDGVTVKL